MNIVSCVKGVPLITYIFQEFGHVLHKLNNVSSLVIFSLFTKTISEIGYVQHKVNIVSCGRLM